MHERKIIGREHTRKHTDNFNCITSAMISAVAAHARPASCAASTNPLAELVTDTKLIFDLIRRRKALLVRAFTVSEVAQLREEHSQLL